MIRAMKPLRTALAGFPCGAAVSLGTQLCRAGQGRASPTTTPCCKPEGQKRPTGQVGWQELCVQEPPVLPECSSHTSIPNGTSALTANCCLEVLARKDPGGGWAGRK